MDRVIVRKREFPFSDPQFNTPSSDERFGPERRNTVYAPVVVIR